jgi:hypothetical protein
MAGVAAFMGEINKAGQADQITNQHLLDLRGCSCLKI